MVVGLAEKWKGSAIERAIARQHRHTFHDAAIGKRDVHLRRFLAEHTHCRQKIGEGAEHFFRLPSGFLDHHCVKANARHLHKWNAIGFKQIHLAREAVLDDRKRALERGKWNAHLAREHIHRPRGQDAEHGL